MSSNRDSKKIKKDGRYSFVKTVKGASYPMVCIKYAYNNETGKVKDEYVPKNVFTTIPDFGKIGNKTCIGFNTKADGSGTKYELNEQYTFVEDITLYALWEEEEFYLTLIANEDDVDICYTTAQSDNPTFRKMYFSLDKKEWTQFANASSLNVNTIITKLEKKGDKVYFKGDEQNQKSTFRFAFTKEVIADGYLSSLYNIKDIDSPDLSLLFSYLFYNCNLIKAPNMSNLKQINCASTFAKCPLTFSEEIDLSGAEYISNMSNMFDSTNIKSVNIKNIKQISSIGGLKNAFYNCKQLERIEIGDYFNTSYASGWVTGVSSTGVFVKGSSLSIPYGTNGIPNGWQIINK